MPASRGSGENTADGRSSSLHLSVLMWEQEAAHLTFTLHSGHSSWVYTLGYERPRLVTYTCCEDLHLEQAVNRLTCAKARLYSGLIWQSKHCNRSTCWLLYVWLIHKRKDCSLALITWRMATKSEFASTDGEKNTMLGAVVMVHMKKTTSHVHNIWQQTAVARTSSQHPAIHESVLFRDTPSKLEPTGLFMGQTIPRQ